MMLGSRQGDSKNGPGAQSNRAVLVMSRRVQIVQPPRIATRLVGLFITEEQTGEQEEILDEFSEMALRRGIGPARRWYWKQSAKTIAGHIAREFRTAPWLIVGAAFGGALLFYLGTGYLQEAILRLLDLLNHHVMPYYDRAGADRHGFWIYYTVLIGSLFEALIVGCLVAVVAKRREMVAAMSLSFISLVVTVTDFWVSVAIEEHKLRLGTLRAVVDPVLFPHILIDQLGASLLMIIGGLIVRELRSAAAHSVSRA